MRYDAGLGAGNYAYALVRRLSQSASGTTFDRVDLPGVRGHHASVDDSVVAWIGLDGKPRIAPVAQWAFNFPRALGNPILRRNDGQWADGFKPPATWSFELPTTAPLTSCSVAIKSGTTTIRTLACDPTIIKTGEAKAVWDGKNTAGVTQSAGTYNWSVTANGTDGALAGAGTNTEAATSGTVKILP